MIVEILAIALSIVSVVLTIRYYQTSADNEELNHIVSVVTARNVVTTHTVQSEKIVHDCVESMNVALINCFCEQYCKDKDAELVNYLYLNAAHCVENDLDVTESVMSILDAVESGTPNFPPVDNMAGVVSLVKKSQELSIKQLVDGEVINCISGYARLEELAATELPDEWPRS